MAEEKVQAPPTSAGIIRFYDLTTSNIQLDPKLVVAVCIGVIVIELALQILLK